MPNEPDLLDKHQAAKRLGVHWRTVLLFANDRKLESVSIRDAKTNQMTTKFPAEAVERLRKERSAPAVNIKPVERAEKPSEQTALQRVQSPATRATGGGEIAVNLAALLGSLPALGPLNHPKPWLNLQEASEYSGLSTRLLRLLVRRGELPALRDEPVRVKGQKLTPGETLRIKRADLDALEGDELPGSRLEQVATAGHS